MASWANQKPSGSATRRRWEIEDRQSFNAVQFHFAAEGSSETQYDLARQLLEKTKEPGEKSSNEQAVHWLLCAAEEGHEKAAELLEKCYAKNCGITPENEAEVRSCLKMTPGERAARKAARELFACLSNGNEHITPKQLERKMRKIYNLQKKRRRRGDSSSTSTSDDSENDDAQRPRIVNGNDADITLRQSRQRRLQRSMQESAQNEYITEENLVSAAANYTAGRLPIVNDALTLSVPDPTSLDHVPCFHRLIFHPIVFCTLLYHRLINLISALPTAVPPNVRLAIILVVYWLGSQENLSHFLPITFYYACLGVMVWATCKMLKTKHDFIDFRIWSGLFLSYGDHIEADISEHRFLRNNMKPYLYFFGAFIGSLLVHPLLVSEWLPHSELTILSGIFVFVSLVSIMYSSARSFPDWIMLISFGVNVLAKYPYEMDDVVKTGWRFLDLKVPTFSSFVIGNGIEFCLNCRTALYLLIPGLLIHLARRSNWHGIYSYLIPHCVTLSWLQLCISSSQSATMFGVMRATLGLAGILLFLPLFGIVSLMIPVFVAVDWMGFVDPNIRFGSTVIALIIALLTSCFLAINRTTQKYVTVTQLLICIIGACVLISPYMTSTFKDTSRFSAMRTPNTAEPTDAANALSADSLDWQHFQQFCGSSSWKHQNKLKAQIRCAHLDGMTVEWSGIVTQVQIRQVTNLRAEYIEKLLPQWLGNMVRCFFGVSIRDGLACHITDTETKEDTKDTRLCANLQQVLKRSSLQDKCSLHDWNTYEFEIRIRMPTGLLSKGADVVLHAEHRFMNFTSRLFAGDDVKFMGQLHSKHVLPNGDVVLLGGSSNTYIQLSSIECIACNDKNIPPAGDGRHVKSLVDARLRDLMRGIKYLLNVLFNPLIIFKKCYTG